MSTIIDCAVQLGSMTRLPSQNISMVSLQVPAHMHLVLQKCLNYVTALTVDRASVTAAPIPHRPVVEK